MREFAAENFRFRLQKPEGKNGRWQDGRFERDGIILGEDKIFFQDIYDTQHYGKYVVITLFPFATISKVISDSIMPNTFSIVMKVGELAEAVEYGIDAKISENWLKNKVKGMSYQEQKKLHVVTCPNCTSKLDLTGVVKTNNIYCYYCDNLFDRNGIVRFSSKQYQICPECNYYGRVQDYHEYLISLKGFTHRKHFCCDTCTLRIFRRTFFWNLFPFVVGAFLSLREWMKSQRDRNPYMLGLAKANLLAQDGKLIKADEEYTSILTKNFGHPGIHYNYGLASLAAGNPERAAKEFQIALQNCANYEPVIKIMQKHHDLKIPDPNDNQVEIWDLEVE